MINEPFKCDHCNRAFGSAHEKKRHIELAHREEIEMATTEHVECVRKGCHAPVVPGKRICAAHYAVVIAGQAKKLAPVAPTDQPTGDGGFEHCDHVEDCGISGITDCGTDPCNLVDEWRNMRCEYRTDTECSNRPCHDCEVEAYRPRKLKTIHVPVVADVRVRVNEPDYRMELIETLADLADRELYIAEHIDPEDRDFSLVYDALARIKAVARDV